MVQTVRETLQCVFDDTDNPLAKERCIKQVSPYNRGQICDRHKRFALKRRCTGCERLLADYHKSGTCAACRVKARRDTKVEQTPQGPVCSGKTNGLACTTVLSSQNVSGRCPKHPKDRHRGAKPSFPRTSRDRPL